MVDAGREQSARALRIVVVLTITGWSVAFASWQAEHRPLPSDFAQAWAAARFLLAGLNPYDLIGPDRPWHWNFPLLYPLPAAVIALPLAPLPRGLAELAFVGISTALLGWTLTRDRVGNPQLWVFSSHAWLFVLHNAQWSPLMVAAALTPSLGFLLACKPTIGAALWCAYPSRRALVGAGVLTAATVAIWPWWIPAWREGLSAAVHIGAPITFTGGPLVLLALIEWRSPEARLLVALACAPQTPVLYEAAPLFLLVRHGWEGLALSALTAVAFAWGEFGGATGHDALMAQRGQVAVWVLYLPCTALILARSFVARWRYERELK